MRKRKLTIEEIHRLETEMLKVTDEICKRNNIKYSLICGSVLGAVRHKGPIPWDTDSDITVSYEIMGKLCSVLEEQLPEWCCVYNYKNTKDFYRFLPRIGVKGYDSAILHIDIFPQVGLPDDSESQKKYDKWSKRLNKLFCWKLIAQGDNLYTPGGKLRVISRKIAKFILKIVLAPFSREFLYKLVDSHYSKYPYSESKYVMNPLGHYGMKNVLDKNYFEDLIDAEYDGIKLSIPREYDKYLRHYYKDYEKIPPKEDRDKMMAFTVYVDEDFDVDRIIEGN